MALGTRNIAFVWDRLPSQEDEERWNNLFPTGLWQSLEEAERRENRVREEFSWLDEVPWKSKFIRFTS